MIETWRYRFPLDVGYDLAAFQRDVPATMWKEDAWPEPHCAEGHDDEPRYKLDALGRPMFVIQCARCGCQRSTFINVTLAYRWLNAAYGCDIRRFGDLLPPELFGFDEAAESAYWERCNAWRKDMKGDPKIRLERRLRVFQQLPARPARTQENP